jgi:hypothetical protein
LCEISDDQKFIARNVNRKTRASLHDLADEVAGPSEINGNQNENDCEKSEGSFHKKSGPRWETAKRIAIQRSRSTLYYRIAAIGSVALRYLLEIMGAKQIDPLPSI